MKYQDKFNTYLPEKFIAWIKESQGLLIIILLFAVAILFQNITANKYRNCMNQATREATILIEYENETRHYERFLSHYDDAFGECMKTITDYQL